MPHVDGAWVCVMWVWAIPIHRLLEYSVQHADCKFSLQRAATDGGMHSNLFTSNSPMVFCGTLHSKGKRMEVSRNEDYYLCLGRSFAWATATSTSIANANINRIRFDRMPFPRHRIRAKTKIEIHKSGQWNVLDESLHSQPSMPIAHCPLSIVQCSMMMVIWNSSVSVVPQFNSHANGISVAVVLVIFVCSLFRLRLPNRIPLNAFHFVILISSIIRSSEIGFFFIDDGEQWEHNFTLHNTIFKSEFVPRNVRLLHLLVVVVIAYFHAQRFRWIVYSLFLATFFLCSASKKVNESRKSYTQSRHGIPAHETPVEFYAAIFCNLCAIYK